MPMKSSVSFFFIALLFLMTIWHSLHCFAAEASTTQKNTPIIGKAAFSIENHNEVYSAPNADSKVAFLGDSWDDANDPSGINDVILERLFTIIKGVHAQMVFFTGDLALGLERVHAPKEKSTTKRFLYEYDINETNWAEQGLAYRSESYSKQLQAFADIQRRNLGSGIPFFPLSGEHESMGADSLDIFRAYFGLTTIKPQNMQGLAYTVSIGRAFFVVLSAFEPFLKDKSSSELLKKNILMWMDEQLKTAGQSRYLFVVGHEPAFSTTETFGKFRGLDKDPHFRDAFWNILVKNHVLAYFCSHENLYDRSYRNGVWQFISGGAGAPFRLQEFDRAFYHFLLLTVPGDKNKKPEVNVVDSQGILRDTIKLTESFELYQKRIAEKPESGRDGLTTFSGI